MLAGVLLDLVELVLPRSCVGCGRDGAALCPGCGAFEPVEVVSDGLRIVAAGRYEDVLRTALLAFKERGRRDLAAPLGALLARAVDACALDAGALDAGALDAEPAAVVPVPSSPAARRARGGDHMRRLAGAARRRGAGRPIQALRLVRAVRDSAGLDAGTRAVNLDRAMAAAPPPYPGRRAIVVDDITTTGTTLLEATRALRCAGWTVAGAAVVAATPRRFPHAQQVHDIHTGATPGTAPRAGLT